MSNPMAFLNPAASATFAIPTTPAGGGRKARRPFRESFRRLRVRRWSA